MQFLTSLFIIMCCSVSLFSQSPIYLQIEDLNSTDLIKYYPGQKIKFSTRAYPDAWLTEKIISINPEGNLIILSTGFIKPEEIHAVERTNRGANLMGNLFSTFGAAWLVFGGYAHIADKNYKMSFVEVIIGTVATGFGWILKKLFKKKKYPMDNFYRLRVMDIRFPAPYIQTP